MQEADPRRVARLIEAWFARHQRPLPWRDGYEPYRVWLSEIMLQQTRVDVVLPYFTRFLARFPNVQALAAAADDDVTAAWSGLGYYRRARMLRDGAMVVVERFGGEVPSTVEELLTIPGIGRYTAGAIASIAFERRAPIVDGNVARVVSRLFATDDDAWPYADALVANCTSPRALNQGLMELGALLCTPRNPSCLLCPARAACIASTTGRVDEFPRAKPKTITRDLRIPLFIISDRHGRILMRREEGALMNGMWHLPHGDTSLLGGKAFVAKAPQLLGSIRHTVTNRKIEFIVYTASAPRVLGEYAWIALSALDDLPHPSYVRKALRLRSAGS